MRITYPIAAAFIVLRRVRRLAVVARRTGHDEFASIEEQEEAREISEFEILGA